MRILYQNQAKEDIFGNLSAEYGWLSSHMVAKMFHRKIFRLGRNTYAGCADAQLILIFLIVRIVHIQISSIPFIFFHFFLCFIRLRQFLLNLSDQVLYSFSASYLNIYTLKLLTVISCLYTRKN